MPTGRFVSVALTGAVLVLGACGDSTGPSRVRGTFVLAEVDGDPVPSVLFDATGPAGHAYQERIADTLEFVSDSIVLRRGTDRQVLRDEWGAVWLDREIRLQNRGRYLIRDGVAFVSWGIRAEQPDTLWLRDGGIAALERRPELGCIECPDRSMTLHYHRP